MALRQLLLIFSLSSGMLALTVEGHQHGIAFVKGREDSPYAELHFAESEEASPSTEKSCPTWFYRNHLGTCVCGRSLDGVVHCDPSSNQTSIIDCYGMTFSTISGRRQTVVGDSIYNCFNTTSYTHRDAVYRRLPTNISLLNSTMCNHLNRKGVLCGDCKDNFYLAPYTYSIGCFNCTYSPYYWLWYAAVAYIPLTVFFVIMVSCRISVISGQLTAFVNFSQTLTSSISLRVVIAALGSSTAVAGPYLPVSILAALYGVWNLDFFRTLVPPICLKVSFLQATALDYAIAVYPLILIGISYALIELHEHNFRLVVWVWRPFHRCFARLRNCDWNMKTSIIDAFATFLFLSYMKILSVSTDILLYTNIYDIEGRQLTKRLYYNASVEYFSAEHLPYAITAIAVLIIFVLTPLILLLLYPLRGFQKCLDYCHLRTHLLTTFVDSVQGCYKDGTNGTRDYRYFSTAYIILRITMLCFYGLTPNAYFFAIAGLPVAVLAILYFVLQPYKKPLYNYVDGIFCLNLAMSSISMTSLSVADVRNPKCTKLSLFFSVIFTTGPLVYITVMLCYWVVVRKQLPQRFLLRIRRRVQNGNGQSYESPDDSFPHRLLFPEEYNQVALLPPQGGPDSEDSAVDEDYANEEVTENSWNETEDSSPEEEF